MGGGGGGGLCEEKLDKENFEILLRRMSVRGLLIITFVVLHVQAKHGRREENLHIIMNRAGALVIMTWV